MHSMRIASRPIGSRRAHALRFCLSAADHVSALEADLRCWRAATILATVVRAFRFDRVAGHKPKPVARVTSSRWWNAVTHWTGETRRFRHTAWAIAARLSAASRCGYLAACLNCFCGFQLPRVPRTGRSDNELLTHRNSARWLDRLVHADRLSDRRTERCADRVFFRRRHKFHGLLECR